jgi:peptidoglycan/LPS O-acetylase OafA/YrhL
MRGRWEVTGQNPESDPPRFGSLAVLCFFAISGYLISMSRESTTGGRYMWHRFLRIFPGYWVCVVFIAAVVAPLAWFRYQDTLGGYPVGEALKYVAGNFVLKTTLAPTIAGTQTTVDPDLQYWNGAAWSLFFEFLCYILVAVLAWMRLLKPLGMGIVFAVGSALLLAWEMAPEPMEALLFRSHDAYRLVTTGTVFAAGSLMYLYRSRVVCSWRVATCMALVLVPGLAFLKHPEWAVAVPVAYLVIWLGIRLPFHNLAKTDISYGTYIYAYPVATLLTIYGVNDLGLLPYIVITFLIVVPLAYASWFGVEKKALRFKHYGAPRRGAHVLEVSPEPAGKL